MIKECQLSKIFASSNSEKMIETSPNLLTSLSCVCILGRELQEEEGEEGTREAFTTANSQFGVKRKHAKLAKCVHV